MDTIPQNAARMQLQEYLARSRADNPFRAFWDLGYRLLVPIIPPDAELSPNSKIAKRVGAGNDPRGKAPARKGSDGLWSGFDWLKHEATEADLDRWHEMGAGVGIRTGKQPDGSWLLAIDADTLDATAADTIEHLVLEHVGLTSKRVGRAPKALYPVRCMEPLRYSRLMFGDNERIEILSDGRQFVAHGIHPVTRQPYVWPRALVLFDQLPVLSPKQLLAGCLTGAEALLPQARPIKQSGGGQIPPQESLRAPAELVQKAVAAIPNTNELFPGREDFLKMAYAIKAAVENDAEAFEIFSEWFSRWDAGYNDPEAVRAEWDRMPGPYRIGAPWLFKLAREHGGYQHGAEHFDAEMAAQAIEAEPQAANSNWPEPFDLFGNADPVELSELPENSLPTIVADWVQTEAKRKGVSPAFAAAAAVSVIGASIGSSLKLSVRLKDTGWLEPGALWMVLIAEPGRGKSPIIAEALSPARALDRKRYAEDKPRREEWEAAKAKSRKKADGFALPPRPVIRQTVVDDATIEKQILIQAENPHGILRAPDEFLGLLGSLGAYKASGDADRTMLLRMFDGGTISVDRVGGSTRADQALMGLLAGTQPEKIRALVRNLGADGMLQRCIFVLDDGVPRKGVDEQPDEAARSFYSEAVQHFAQMEHGRAATIRLSKPAYDLIQAVTNNINDLGHIPGMPPAFGGHLEKWGKIIPRLTLIFHCLDVFELFQSVPENIQVDVSTAAKAAEFARFLLRHSLRFYETYSAPVETDSEARWIAGHLLTKPDLRQVSRREIYDARTKLRGLDNLSKLLGAMRELENCGWCKVRTRDGSSPTHWDINPQIHHRFAAYAAREQQARAIKQAQIKAAGAVRTDWVNP